MISKLINLCFGYSSLEQKKKIMIPEDTTHMIIFKSNKKYLLSRQYKTLYKYKTISSECLTLPYNKNKGVVYNESNCHFDYLTLPEFKNLVIPNEEIEIIYIPLNDYMNNNIKPVVTKYFFSQDSYICKCKNNSYKCIYHKFLIENLYLKYKNDDFTKNTDSDNYYNDDRSLE